MKGQCKAGKAKEKAVEGQREGSGRTRRRQWKVNEKAGKGQGKGPEKAVKGQGKAKDKQWNVSGRQWKVQERQ